MGISGLPQSSRGTVAADLGFRVSLALADKQGERAEVEKGHRVPRAARPTGAW